MKISSIKEGLSQFRKVFQKILEDDAGQIIDEAIVELESSRERYEKNKKRTDSPKVKVLPWGYKIRPERPLRFITSNAIKGLTVHIDLFCEILWKSENALPVQQVIQVRLWSKEMGYVHRSDWDAEGVFDRIVNEKRVMLRFHLDFAEKDQQGPVYHLQFGGKALAEEVCWFPEIINLPRLHFPPMDLILVGQLIAANFYRNEYLKIRNTPEWIKIVRDSQKSFLSDYYSMCYSTLNHDDILLDALWNTA